MYLIIFLIQTYILDHINFMDIALERTPFKYPIDFLIGIDSQPTCVGIYVIAGEMIAHSILYKKFVFHVSSRSSANEMLPSSLVKKADKVLMWDLKIMSVVKKNCNSASEYRLKAMQECLEYLQSVNKRIKKSPFYSKGSRVFCAIEQAQYETNAVLIQSYLFTIAQLIMGWNTRLIAVVTWKKYHSLPNAGNNSSNKKESLKKGLSKLKDYYATQMPCTKLPTRRHDMCEAKLIATAARGVGLFDEIYLMGK